jgi:Flp pilus assembly CpaF family ATPase
MTLQQQHLDGVAGNGRRTQRPAWEQANDTRAEPKLPARPAWQEQNASAGENGQFAAFIAATRKDHPLTPAQIAAALDVIAHARKSGADMEVLHAMAPPDVRMPAFAALMRPAIERGAIPGLTLTDTATMQALYDATLSPGPVVQRLIDDPSVTEVKIIGTAVQAISARGAIVIPQAYQSVEEPRSYVQAQAQIRGVTWDAKNPSVTIPLSHKNRLHITRDPMVGEDDILIVIRRGRTSPWTLQDQVARKAISAEAAMLLTPLMRALLATIISGPQNTGKTTLGESFINTLPPGYHMILVEDNTDEFSLQSTLVTRLRVNTKATDQRTTLDMAVKESLRMTPDLLTLGEIRDVEAASAIQMAEAGRPLLTTTHARSPRAALFRIAGMASGNTGSRFHHQPGLALQVLCESFQLIVQMQFSRRLHRRFVQSVAFLGGLTPHGQPALVPLIEAHYDDAAEGGIRWDCHARFVDGRLVWEQGYGPTPEIVAELLVDTSESSGYSGRHTLAAGDAVAELLARVRDSLPYGDQAPYAAQLLEQAYKLDPHQRDIWTLAQQVVANRGAGWERIRDAAEAAVHQLETAVETRDLEAAQAAIATTTDDLMLQVALQQDARWQAAQATYAQLEDRIAALQAALESAHAIGKQGDFARALRMLQPFHPPTLPTAWAQHLLEARVHLLRAHYGDLQRRDPLGNGTALIAQQLVMAEQALATLVPALAPIPHELANELEAQWSPHPDEPIVEEPPATQTAAVAVSTPPLWFAAPGDEQITRTPMVSAEEQERGTLAPPPMSAPTAVPSVEQAMTAADLAVEEPVDLYPDGLPFRPRAAAEVGHWRDFWQQITHPAASENLDSHNEKRHS